MSMRTFCDLCDRDISKHDRMHIRLDCGNRDVMLRKHGSWDVCITCARKLDFNKLIQDAETEDTP